MYRIPYMKVFVAQGHQLKKKYINKNTDAFFVMCTIRKHSQFGDFVSMA